MTKLERVHNILVKAVESLPEEERQLLKAYLSDFAVTVNLACEVADLPEGSEIQQQRARILARMREITSKWE